MRRPSRLHRHPARPGAHPVIDGPDSNAPDASPGPQARLGSDAGIGIVEILVAMAVFGVLMASVTPLLLNSITQTARAAQLATASQIANQQVERARSAATDCGQLVAHLTASSGAAQAAVHDSRGITYAVTETAPGSINCPDADGLVTYAVTVEAQTNTSRPVRATVETQIWVGK
ncbi:type II secretion system protein [Cellulomonas sp. NPDC089187]|uniref:type IV pilus modification PilV family protein n=1 Tax=Cellulomonas sp. NPDC089187 TaxID=3154970 RepID=UPI003438A299